MWLSTFPEKLFSQIWGPLSWWLSWTRARGSSPHSMWLLSQGNSPCPWGRKGHPQDPWQNSIFICTYLPVRNKQGPNQWLSHSVPQNPSSLQNGVWVILGKRRNEEGFGLQPQSTQSTLTPLNWVSLNSGFCCKSEVQKYTLKHTGTQQGVMMGVRVLRLITSQIR